MKPKTKITYVISGVNYSLEFIWLARYIDRSKFDIDFIWLNKKVPDLHREMKAFGIPSRYINSPSKYLYPLVFLKLFAHFYKRKPEVVHAHIFEAVLLSMPAAKCAFVPKRMFTRHNSTYHANYFPHLVKYDKMMSRLATHIVSISDNVTNILIQNEHVKADKIHKIPHGFEFKSFREVPAERTDILRSKYNIGSGHHPVVGCISRFIELKGIQYTIEAFKELRRSYPNAHLVLANAVGDYAEELKTLYQEIPASHLTIIEFEKDLFALYQLFDLFVHVPIDPYVEAFGQVYIEALAAGLPCIYTLSGIAHECIVHEENALIVPYENSEAIYRAMLRIVNDESLNLKLRKQGFGSIAGKYDIGTVTVQLERTYEK